MSTADMRCESTTNVRGADGGARSVRCWLLLPQHKADMNRKHWAIVDGKPHQWEGTR